MSAEVIISKVPARTYTVPAALVASVGERAALDVVYDTLNSSHEPAREWAEKIINGIERDRQKQEQAVLASIGYNPQKYFYWGLTASGDDDLIYAVGRLQQPDTNIENAEILSQKGNWTPISPKISSDLRQKGVAMDPGLIAYTASAFAEGCRGVKLAYGNPLYFFETQPLQASALIAATTPAPNDGLVYAIVDATDTTAVMSVIMIKPGPQVYRRDGGAWVLDNNTLDSLMSVNPPPIVELSGSTLSDVLQQVDMGQANQVAPTGDGQADTGQALVAPDMQQGASQGIQQDPEKAATQTDVGDFSGSGGGSSSSSGIGTTLPTPAPSDSPSRDTYSSNQNKSQLKDGSTAQTAALLARYDELEEALTTIRAMSSVVASAFEPYDAKANLMKQIADKRKQLELREAHINNVVLPALLADAQSVHDATPNQLKARHLRQYWVHGAGAVKIRWGTEGDWTRCVRQLSKYLGERAKGYCSKRHREVVGYWPGDKKNTGPLHGNTGAVG